MRKWNKNVQLFHMSANFRSISWNYFITSFKAIVGEKDYLEYDSSGFLQTLRTEVAIDEGKATLSVRGQDVDAYLEKYPNKFDISVFDYCKMAIEGI